MKIYKCPKKAILASESGFAEFCTEKTFDIPLRFRVYGGLNNKYWLLWQLKEKHWIPYPGSLTYEDLLKFTDTAQYVPVELQNLKIDLK